MLVASLVLLAAGDVGAQQLKPLDRIVVKSLGKSFSRAPRSSGLPQGRTTPAELAAFAGEPGTLDGEDADRFDAYARSWLRKDEAGALIIIAIRGTFSNDATDALTGFVSRAASERPFRVSGIRGAKGFQTTIKDAGGDIHSASIGWAQGDIFFTVSAADQNARRARADAKRAARLQQARAPTKSILPAATRIEDTTAYKIGYVLAPVLIMLIVFWVLLRLFRRKPSAPSVPSAPGDIGVR